MEQNEWKEYKAHKHAERLEIELSRMNHAKERLEKAGIEVKKETTAMIEFEHKGQTVTFWPYTGWFSGKTVIQGRGINNLMKQL